MPLPILIYDILAEFREVIMWNAFCDHESHGHAGWDGPNRDIQNEARADADAHNRQNPGHKAVDLGPD